MDIDKIEKSLDAIEDGSEMMTSNANIEMLKADEVEVEEVIPETVENNPVINEYLNSDFGSYQEQEIKKMMAAAAIASGSEATPEEVASQADTSAVSIKTAYKVSTGQLDITRSTDVLIDQAAARLNTFIQEKLDMNRIGEAVVDAVAYVYPPVKLLKPYVRVVMKKVEPVVRKAITTGIKTVATYAKKTVRTISAKVKNLAKALLA